MDPVAVPSDQFQTQLLLRLGMIQADIAAVGEKADSLRERLEQTEGRGERRNDEIIAAMDQAHHRLREDLRQESREIHARVKRHEDFTAGLDGRLQRLERWQSWVIGAVAVAGFIVSAIGAGIALTRERIMQWLGI